MRQIFLNIDSISATKPFPEWKSYTSQSRAMTEIRVTPKKLNYSRSNYVQTHLTCSNVKGECFPTELICWIFKILNDKFTGLF